MRVALAAVVSAVVLFFFGFLWWGVMMPLLRPADVLTDQALVDSMASSLHASGLYFYPAYTEPMEEESSPMAILYFNPDGPSLPRMMAFGFAHMLASALLASIFLAFIGPRTFIERLAIVFFLGLFVAVWADVGNMIWWLHPVAWTAFHFAYDALSWLLAGLVIAAIVRPKEQAPGTLDLH